MKRSEQIRSLACLQDAIKVDNEHVHINPLILFGRLTTLAQRQEDIKEQFKYELTPEPASLFKDGLMRKPTKSTLRTHLTKNASTPPTTPSKNVVIDGGALLWNVNWLRNSTYDDITNQYARYLHTKHGYSEIDVVFDGYDDPLSTKTHEHTRRKVTSSADVNITDASMRVTCTRKTFLQNTHNKTELIRILQEKLSNNGIQNEQSVGDADILTVKTALQKAEHQETTVVSDDTDILAMLMYHWKPTMKDILFSTTTSVNKKKVHVEYSLKDLVSKFPLVRSLLFAHAWTGCDTTSAIQKQGKVKIIQMLNSRSFQEIVSCFGDVFATPDIVGKCGIEIFLKR